MLLHTVLLALAPGPLVAAPPTQEEAWEAPWEDAQEAEADDIPSEVPS